MKPQDKEIEELIDELESLAGSRTHARRPRRRKALALWVILLTAGTAMAAIFLFNQNYGAPTVTGAIITKNCDPGAPSGNIVAGTSGFVIWSCPAPNTGSIHAHLAGPVSAVITAGSAWTTIYLVRLTGASGPTSNCASASIHTPPLVTGSGGNTVTFLPADINTEWTLCADYANAQPATMTAISIAWTQ
jgi:hypothetical protein